MRPATSPDGISTALLSLSDAASLLPEWRRLADGAVEPNVFYGPEMTLAAMRHLPGGDRVRVVAAWRERPEGRDLVGILPVERGGRRHANLGTLRRAASFAFTLSTPLLAADRPDATLAAMLGCLASHGIAALALPHLSAGGPIMEAVRRLEGRGHAVETLETHRRALLRSELDGAAYLRATFKSAKRNKLDRQRRKLAEAGAIRFEVAATAEAVEAALPEFLALEAAGWKGRAGTALARAPGAAQFMEEAAGGLAAAGRFWILSLRQNERCVASWLVATAQSRAYCLKIAYDEDLARLSPGVMLAVDATVHLLDDPSLDDADSIAIAGHPMIDGIWTERFDVASVVVATAPGRPTLRFRLAVAVERMREAIVARIKARRSRPARSEAGAPPT